MPVITAGRKLLPLLETMSRLGPSFVIRGGLHRVKVKTGVYRAILPLSCWHDLPEEVVLQARSPFSPPREVPLPFTSGDSDSAAADGSRILDGDILYFSRQWLRRPADWRSNPFTGYRTPDFHWSLLGDFDPRQGDIKYIWEPSRFDWVYQLGRAWGATGDETFVDGFWRMLDDWREHNRPNLGVNWKCGQECSFRLFALVWAAGVFSKTAATTPDRLSRLWGTVAALARRVEGAFGYALAQNNNHGLSEAAALYLAGSCLPGHPRAGRWRRLGKRKFSALVLRQFDPDGSYVQHSMNYARLALRDAFLVLYTAEHWGDSFPESVHERLRAALRFLHQMQDGDTGALPNYGANDGANIIALSSCGYADFRPVLQTMGFILDKRRIFPPGPYDEELLWHFGTDAAAAPLASAVRENFGAPGGGYFVIRNGNSFGMTRCHTFRTRPGHADMLHFDLWVNGTNVAFDGGTYQYFDPFGYGDYFKSTAAHNTVTVDGRDQMRKGSRFLWLEWTQSKLLEWGVREGGSCRVTCWQGEHYGYSRGRDGVRHRRSIMAAEGDWLVIDDLILDSKAWHDFALSWHLAGDDWKIGNGALTSDSLGISISCLSNSLLETDLLRGEENFPLTGRSLYYGEISPLTLLRVRCRQNSPVRLITVFGGEAVLPEAGNIFWKGISVPLVP